MPPPGVSAAAKYVLSDIHVFSRTILQRPLRPYQLEPAYAILESALFGKGMDFVVTMSRQAGKNELTAQLEAYLLNMYQRLGGQIVKASPTFKPQTINSMLRLEEHLNNPLNRPYWRRREGYMFQLRNARALFFSAERTANVVGGTASLLLECDEAQDVSELKWTRDFEPMGASSNVTTVFTGTPWTSDTFLAQTTAYLQQLQHRDGLRRVFSYNADVVGEHVPAYRDFVDRRIAKLGRNHPLIRTQYFLETIDGDARMFPPNRQALMRGDHERQHDPTPGHRYALLIDVAGEDEAQGDSLSRAVLANAQRDATALTVVDVDYTYGQLPTYRTVDRHLWIGTKHTALYQIILALAGHWHPVWLVVDATGIGAGLASFLATALGHHSPPSVGGSRRGASSIGGSRSEALGHPSPPSVGGSRRGASTIGGSRSGASTIGGSRSGALGHPSPPSIGGSWRGATTIIPVTFSAKTKSDLGWKFLAIVETGRYQDYIPDEEPETRQFWYEVEACQREVRSGPNRLLKWGVWETPAYDGLIARGHDDLLLSAALTAILDHQDWPGTAEGASVETGDPLDDIDQAEW